MNLLELTLLRFLHSGKLKLEITGFDMEAFGKAIHKELSRRLNTIEGILFEDSDILSDAEKVEQLKRLYEEEFTS